MTLRAILLSAVFVLIASAARAAMPATEDCAPKNGFVSLCGVNRQDGEIRKIDLATGALLGTAKVPWPDNISWGEDGRLIIGTGPIPRADGDYEIIAIDPASMTAETLFSRAGAPMEHVSVGVEADGAFYFGAAFGNRVVRVPMPPKGVQ